ncbi:MAG: cation:proton antiporter [Lawsonibacter sp.]|jgi:Kef-type K+ transport system membrane component KefB
MDSYGILKDMAIILVAAKLCGLLARQFHMPSVVGEIIAGLLVGPCVFHLVAPSDFLTQMAEIGVVLLMFSAGLESDTHEIIRSGPKALAIATSGVILPLLLGTGLFLLFYGGVSSQRNLMYEALFIGCILTATSVSITVEALKELGHLKEPVGTTILSAAIIDDVLGIIVLTLISGLKDPNSSLVMVAWRTLLFFLFAGVIGFLIYQAFEWMDEKHPKTRRLPILALAFCLAMAYIAEEYFGIADITGAYVAGVVLSNLNDAPYIERKMDVNSYTIFGPVFFASIGLSTDVGEMDTKLLLFTGAFLLVALLSKVIGCGGMARLCGFKRKDALKIGVGMMNRGEVALIVAQKGLLLGLLNPMFFTSVIILILVSAIVKPIFLKLLYRQDDLASAPSNKLHPSASDS